MKRLSIALMGVLMLFSACSKDDSSSGSNSGGGSSSNPLIGMWSQDAVEHSTNASRDEVYQFIDDNTVISYGRCWNTSAESYGMTKSPLPDHYGWYYFDINRKMYTYALIDNKVYVTEGVIMTLMGDELYIDGVTRPLHRF